MPKSQKYNLIDTETGKVIAEERHTLEQAEKHNQAYRHGALLSGGKPLKLMRK